MYFKKIIFVVLLIVVNLSQAIVVDVNQTSILSEDTVANDPLKLKQAFAQIIAINTGENITTILENPIFDEANIRSGIKRSYFEKIDSKFLTADSLNKFWFYLVMQEDFIQRIIKQAGFPVLPNNREKIMLWVVKEGYLIDDVTGDVTQDILSYAHNDEIVKYWVEHWSHALGLHVIYPEIDEQDMLAVRLNSIKSLSFEANEQSKNRYNNYFNLLIYIKNNGETLKIRSGLVINDKDMSIRHFQEDSASEGEVLYAVFADVAARYAYNFKIESRNLENHTLQFVVNSIQDYNNLNQVSKYFNNLSVIESYHIVSATQGQLIVTADLSITTEAFLQIIERDKVLSYSKNISINQLVFNAIR